MPHWYESQSNLTELYFWLRSNGCFAATRDTTNFWTEPWTWNRHWELFQEWRSADSPRVKKALRDALVEDKTAGDVLSELEESGIEC